MVMKRFIAPRFKVISSLCWDQPPWCCRPFDTYCARSAAVHLAVRTFSEGEESESCRATLTFLTEREREPARRCSKQQISQLYNTAYRCRVCRGSSSDGQDENDHKSLQRTLHVWRYEMVLVSTRVRKTKWLLSQPNNMYFLCPEVSLEFSIAPCAGKKVLFLIRRNVQKWNLTHPFSFPHNKH